jgi:hypothetical protein
MRGEVLRRRDNGCPIPPEAPATTALIPIFTAFGGDQVPEEMILRVCEKENVSQKFVEEVVQGPKEVKC